MKYSWTILLLILCGCNTEQNNENIHNEIDKTTVSKTYFLRTVVHDEHLFLISNYGGLMHHPNCPCLTNKLEKEENKTQMPPIIIDLMQK